ncbi:MAG: hypothetical protein IJI19_02395 [Ruminococcus sp.]|nr:hypothetical protein [Ruminococcus sp.]
MKRRFIPLILCLFCVLLFSACGAPADVDGAMTPIKDENGAVTGYERKYHNDNGDVTRWDIYDAQEQYDHYVLYEYDSNGRLGKETYYRADGIGVYYNAYSYTEDGVIAEMDYASAKEGSTRTLYDEEGKESKRMTYDINDELVKYEEFADGDWVEKPLPTESTDPTEADAE